MSPKFLAMNKLLFLPLILAVAGCQIDAVKNTYSISGKIGFGDVTYLMDGLSVSLLSGDQIIATSESPEFIFTNLEEGKSYLVLPQVAIGSRDGVSTLDWVMIDKYIQGQQVFDAYQKIAGDVNRNDLISTEDMDLIRDCIVDIENKCFSWRFASEDYDGSGTGYLDQYEIPNLISDVELNFVPIKLGDVNETILPK